MRILVQVTIPVIKYKIASSDIGKRWIEVYGINFSLASSIGYIQKIDVGKTLYIKDHNSIQMG